MRIEIMTEAARDGVGTEWQPAMFWLLVGDRIEIVPLSGNEHLTAPYQADLDYALGRGFTAREIWDHLSELEGDGYYRMRSKATVLPTANLEATKNAIARQMVGIPKFGAPFEAQKQADVPADLAPGERDSRIAGGIYRLLGEKFNPSHDRLGRFASGGGGAGAVGQSPVGGGGGSAGGGGAGGGAGTATGKVLGTSVVGEAQAMLAAGGPKTVGEATALGAKVAKGIDAYAAKHPAGPGGDANFEATNAALAQVRPMGGTLNVAGGTAVATQVRTAAKVLPKSWNDASNGAKPALYAKEKKRGYYNPSSGTIAISGKSMGCATHELGHRMDHVNPKINKLTQDFLTKRTAGETAKQLPGHPKGEVSKPDKFPDPYCGKQYGGHSSEITSQGLQHVFQKNRPGGSWWAKASKTKPDTEYRHLMLGLLAGMP